MALIVSAGGVPPGQYPAAFKGWSQKNNVYGPGLQFEWQITSGDNAGQKASCMQPMPSTANKCGRLLGRMFGRPLKAAEDVEAALTGLVGKPFMVTVEQSKSGASMVADAIPIPTA